MKRIYTLIILSIAVSNFVSAQGSNDKIFHSTGAAAFTDYAQSPVSTFKYTSGYDINGNPIQSTTYAQFEGLSYFTFIYNFRYNISEMSDNSAVTASLIPAVGVYIATTGFSSNGGSDATGFGSFNLPLLLGYEFGAGSTYNSTANMGGFIRFGVEWTKAPLFYDSGDFGSEDVDIKTSWVEPAVQVGVRYWNKKNKLREIAIKYGFGESAPAKDATYLGTETFGSAKTIRLSWMLFLNY